MLLILIYVYAWDTLSHIETIPNVDMVLAQSTYTPTDNKYI